MSCFSPLSLQKIYAIIHPMDIFTLHIGLQIDPPFLRAALLSIQGRRIFLKDVKETLITEPNAVKQLYSPKFKGQIVSGLSAKHVLAKRLELNTKKPKHARAAFLLQNEGTSPLNPQDTIVLIHDMQAVENKTSALVLSASKNAIAEHLILCNNLGADLDRLGANALALLHYAQWKHPKISDAVLIDFGSSEITCALIEKGRLKKAHATDSGIEVLAKALWEDQKNLSSLQEAFISLQTIDAMHFPTLAKKLAEMKQEIEKILHSFARLSSAHTVICTGLHEALPALKESIFASETKTSGSEDKYALAIALAIENTQKPLQLLREKFFPEKHWRQSGRYASLLVALSLGLSALLLAIGLKSIATKEKAIHSAIAQHIQAWGSSENDLVSWLKLIETHRKETPYLSTLPNVSDTLSWLSRHPLAQKLNEESDPIDLLDLRYLFVEYPKIGSLTAPYIAKVELKFSVKNPMNARLFHEALLQGDAFVDATKEISWETFSHSYKTSFFLKKRFL